jgi:hypothetical protein
MTKRHHIQEELSISGNLDGKEEYHFRGTIISLSSFLFSIGFWQVR